MLYEEVAEPYSPTHQLVFISDLKKRIFQLVERHFSNTLYSLCVLYLMDSYKNACKKLDFNLTYSQELAKILEWAAYKYNVENYNKKVKKSRSQNGRTGFLCHINQKLGQTHSLLE